MGMQLGGQGVNAEMNVTPLIDVLLVLLIIFMVVTPLMMMQHRLDVPKKAEVDLPPDVTQDQVVLTYTKDKEIFINHTKVARSILAKSLTEIFQNRREKTMFINIDPKANYGEAMSIIDSVKSIGVEKLAVITLKRGEKFQIPSAAAPVSPTGM